jgi:putative ABC transport system ATP-binding protein
MLPTETPVISMRKVDHFYGTGPLRRQVLFDVTCDIWAGEIVMIAGPSGSGKTTILTLAGALRSVQQGSMRILGEELHGATAETRARIRQNIGFIFQLHNLLEGLTALQNVEIALGAGNFRRSVARERACAILKAVGLGDRLAYHPSRLSGGQRQRVAVARALARGPKIVLADEPTASLDKQSGHDVVELLRQLARREGCAVLLVTHDNRILEFADRLMLLEDGRLGSFEAVSSPHATHLLTALSRMPEKNNLQILLNRMNEREFLELLSTLAAEFEQFLNVLEMGDRDSIPMLFENLLETVFARIAVLIGAERASLLGMREGRLESVVTIGEPKPMLQDLANHAIQRGEIVNSSRQQSSGGVHSILCVPIPGRDQQFRAVALLMNKRGADRFTPADERAFRDLSAPLGMILAAYERVSRAPGAVWHHGAT